MFNSAMSLVIRIRILNGFDDLVQAREAEQSMAGWQDTAKAGLLCDHGFARRQVLRAPLTEPTAAQAHVLVLGYREFAAGASDVVPIGVEIGGKAESVPYFPALALQQELIGLVVTAQGQLKRLARVARQIDEFKELQMFAPVVDFALERKFAARLPPVAYRGERIAATIAVPLPQIEHHGRGRRVEVEAP